MLNRRDFAALIGSATLLPGKAWAQTTIPFYASTGPQLTQYDLDVDGAALTQKATVTLPANIQYAWPDPARRFLYVAVSSNKPGLADHGIQAFRIGADGALTRHGAPVTLAHRPVHCTVDPGGRFLLCAYNIPASVSVHHLNEDGTIGAEVIQAAKLDTGIYAHQLRVSPGGETVVLVTRGNDPQAGHAEDPGALKVFAFKDGQLSNLQSLSPHGNGYGFGPRHLDFAKRFIFVSLERENSICVYGLNADGSLSAEPLFIKNAMTDPGAKAKYPGQTAGPIHVAPNGRIVYQTNRGSGTVDFGGQKVWNGGLNDIVVWKIDPATGEPTRIQNMDAHGFEVRTFSVDPSGKLLIAASQVSLGVRNGETVNAVSAGLALFRIGADGKLTFLSKHDVDTSAGTQTWSGLLTMP